jgi:8-amino-7-oxononanoate synthase
VPRRGDVILYDYLSHASIRDGLKLSNADTFMFRHNDVEHLQSLLERHTSRDHSTFVVESIYSMDGDEAPLSAITTLCHQYGACLIVDEAHATGIAGPVGRGISYQPQLPYPHTILARVHTFGKALGCHGAAITGSTTLRSYLVNFARSFIYTTALPQHAMAAIAAAYGLLPTLDQERTQLRLLAEYYCHLAKHAPQLPRTDSQGSIQILIVPGNKPCREAAFFLQQSGFDVRAILHPTVPKGTERLRICLHSYNTHQQVKALWQCLTTLPPAA